MCVCVFRKVGFRQTADLRDVVNGGLHAAELRRLDVEHLQDVVGQRVDQVGDAGQRLGGVVLGLLQRPLLVWRLNSRKAAAISRFIKTKEMNCFQSFFR